MDYTKIAGEIAANAPALTGTPKQIAWAEKIRTEKLQALAWEGEKAGLHPEGLRLALTRIVRENTDAAWWIDMRHLFGAPVDLAAALLAPGEEIGPNDSIREYLERWQPKSLEEREQAQPQPTVEELEEEKTRAYRHLRKAAQVAHYLGVPDTSVATMVSNPQDLPSGQRRTVVSWRAALLALKKWQGHAAQWWEELGRPGEREAVRMLADAVRQAALAAARLDDAKRGVTNG